MVYQRGYTPRACVCARHSLAPLRGKPNYQHLVFLPLPSVLLRFASPRLDSRSIIEDQSRFTVRILFPSVYHTRERLRTREDRHEDTLRMNEERSHRSLLTRLFVPSISRRVRVVENCDFTRETKKTCLLKERFRNGLRSPFETRPLVD